VTVARSLLTDMTPPFAGGDHRVAMPLVPLQMRRGDRLGWRHTALVDSGAGAGPGLSAWGWEVDLYLGSGSVDDRLLLPAARVYFTESPLAGFDVLLGQHDAFERLTFAQMNHPPRRYFVLRFPTTR